MSITIHPILPSGLVDVEIQTAPLSTRPKGETNFQRIFVQELNAIPEDAEKQPRRETKPQTQPSATTPNDPFWRYFALL